MPNPMQQIDSFYYVGSYNNWKQMDAQRITENNRFKAGAARLQERAFAPITNQARDDIEHLNTIAADYNQTMNNILLGHPPIRQKLDDLNTMYSMALVAAQSENDVLETLFGLGLYAAFVVGPWMLLQAEANGLKNAVAALTKELKEAAHELKKAYVKQGIHLVATFFEEMFPEVSLTARAMIYLGDVVVDKALGPSHQSTYKKYRGDITPGVGQLSEAIKDIPEYSQKAREVAGKTGKVATVATFYFDYEEICEGDDRVEKLRELTIEVKEAYDKTRDFIANHRSKIFSFLASFQRVVKIIDNLAIGAEQAREALSSEIAKNRWDRMPLAAWLASP